MSNINEQALIIPEEKLFRGDHFVVFTKETIEKIQSDFQKKNTDPDIKLRIATVEDEPNFKAGTLLAEAKVPLSFEISASELKGFSVQP